MDSSEKLTETYLQSLFASVVYEPDGNVPPDFLVDGRIAVEVRRLNQNEQTAGKDRGLEETAIPLWRGIKALLTALGPPTNGRSWFISFKFRRPVDPWKTLAPTVENCLKGFMLQTSPVRTRFSIAKNFEIEVFSASQAHSQHFLLGGCIDHDSGGWLLAEMQKNIQLCADQKSKKIMNVRHKYQEWWLVLIDHIGWGLDDFDRSLFHDEVSISHT